jgi:hypothetical protein
MPSPRLSKRKVVAFKLETVEGTAETLAATDVDFIPEEISFVAEPTLVERNLLGPSLAMKPQRVTQKFARVSFKTEIKGSGDAGTEPVLSKLINACGFKTTIAADTSVTYDPVTQTDVTYDGTIPCATGNAAATIWVYEDGLVKKAKNCRGTFSIVGEAGNFAYLTFEFLGVYVETIDAPYPSPVIGGTVDSELAPLVESAAFSIFGLSDIVIRSFSIDMGVSMVPRGDASSASGILGIIINNRTVTATIDPEVGLESGHWTSVPEERLVGATVGAFSIKIGTAAGNILTITAPAQKCQITDVSQADRDGIDTYSLTLGFYDSELTPNADNPEIRMVCT